MQYKGSNKKKLEKTVTMNAKDKYYSGKTPTFCNTDRTVRKNSQMEHEREQSSGTVGTNRPENQSPGTVRRSPHIKQAGFTVNRNTPE